MFETLQNALRAGVLGRVTLLINHVVAAEPAALERLLPHAGRCIQLQFSGWPSLLPALPVTVLRVTPAGLFEATEMTPGDAIAMPPPADLRVEIDASNPAKAMAQALLGERPSVQVSGDANFAGDVQWLFDNLRWDVQDDLARVVGAAPARELSRLGAGVAAALRAAARRGADVAARVRSGVGGPAPR